MRTSPTPTSPRRWSSARREKGLVLLSCGLYGNVIRFLAPLTASDEIVQEGLGIVSRRCANSPARPQEGGQLVSAAGKLSGKVAIVTGGGSGAAVNFGALRAGTKKGIACAIPWNFVAPTPGFERGTR